MQGICQTTDTLLTLQNSLDCSGRSLAAPTYTDCQEDVVSRRIKTPRRGVRATIEGASVSGARVVGARLVGPTAMGPLAIAAGAVVALAIGRVAIANAVIRRLSAGEVEIGRLRVNELEVAGRRWPQPIT